MNKKDSCLNKNDTSISLNQAKERCFSTIKKKLSTEKLAIRSTLNRITAEDIIAPINVPNHINSAMDGYALQKIDIKNSQPFDIIDVAYAGCLSAKKITQNQCIQIMTGAVIPENADIVIPQEFVTKQDQQIVINDYFGGDNIRFVGEDLAKNSIVFKKGRLLSAADLGLLASLGIAEVQVWRKVRVAFFSTGDELCSVGEPLTTGQIYDSNRYSLFAMLTHLNVDLLDMGVIKDNYFALSATFSQAAKCADIVITTGGVSVGEADFVKQVLNDIGSVDFWKLAIKPGRPLTYGKIDDAYFFGLPGNPVAVMITFYQIVQPFLKKIMGQTQNIEPLLVNAISASNILKSQGRTEFIRAKFSNNNGELTVHKLDKQGSGILSSMSYANCLIILSEDMSSIKKGDIVLIQPFVN
ncbi:Molybdopterin biosynthesis protein MoeA [uncultured Candidatus Thioglobus sp.]|nr:Molybdopterin biosynthesis protein MoeA [uncultured Candidatus Thioglobus sp.]SMM98896.1 Molybdopterin biosynthesis protein MoeA [uncultured Candidatus Thioglobus sp.]